METLENLGEVEESQKNKYLTFILEEESFGIDIASVKEIISIQSITSVPYVPKEIKGIINLRGKIIAVIDMRLKLGKTEAIYDDQTCIIIIEIQNMEVGLIVDRVQDVVCINESERMAAIEKVSKASLIQQVAKSNNRIFQIINCSQLIKKEEAY